MQNPFFDQRRSSVALHGQVVGNTHIAGDSPGDSVSRNMADAGIDYFQRRFVRLLLTKYSYGATGRLAKSCKHLDKLCLAIARHSGNSQNFSRANVERNSLKRRKALIV